MAEDAGAVGRYNHLANSPVTCPVTVYNLAARWWKIIISIRLFLIAKFQFYIILHLILVVLNHINLLDFPLIVD